jgi:tellurite resistance-related uncharacterized protein
LEPTTTASCIVTSSQRICFFSKPTTPAGILRQHSRDGSFSNLLVFEGPLRVADFKVPPRIALRVLTRSLAEAVAADQLVDIYEALRTALYRQGLGATYDAAEA